VTVPVDAPFDMNATGTYGLRDMGNTHTSTDSSADAAVECLTEKLDDLPSSLGAEFGSTEDLSLIDSTASPTPRRRQHNAHGRSHQHNGHNRRGSGGAARSKLT
jgi:hypothetical protein